MSRHITTHVLDASTGRPVAGMEFELAKRTTAADDGEVIARGVTDADGRSARLQIADAAAAGIYSLKFATGAYFECQGVATFYPSVTVEFLVAAAVQHYHVPLILSPFGYSTYRGS